MVGRLTWTNFNGGETNVSSARDICCVQHPARGALRQVQSLLLKRTIKRSCKELVCTKKSEGAADLFAPLFVCTAWFLCFFQSSIFV